MFAFDLFFAQNALKRHNKLQDFISKINHYKNDNELYVSTHTNIQNQVKITSMRCFV